MKTSYLLGYPAHLLANFAGLILPALFSLGYSLFSLELFVVILALTVVALLLGFALSYIKRRILNLVCAVLAGLAIHVYFGVYIGDDWSIYFAIGLGLLALVLREGFAAMTSSAALVSCIFAAFNGPALIRSEPAILKSTFSSPTVIHIILDEYGAHSSYPPGIVPDITTDAYEQWYHDRGFVQARRAYSVEEWTQRSTALILNPEIDDLGEVLVKNEPHLVASTWSLSKSSFLSGIAASRRLSIITSTYTDIGAAVRNLDNLGAIDTYNHSVPSPTLGWVAMPVADRIRVMGSLVSSWLYWRQKVTLFHNFLAYTWQGKRLWLWLQAKDRLQPLTGAYVLNDLVHRRIPAMDRGEYLLAHILLPHHPYVFNRDCGLRPVTQWVNPFRWPEEDSMQERARRWPLYVEQVACTHSLLDAMLAAIDANPRLKDATVMLHGDHGSRIGMKNWEKYVTDGYTKATSLVDWHATLLAIRFPDRKARNFDRPVAIHDVMEQMRRNDFSFLLESEIPIRSFARDLFPTFEAR
jgi:hypothetical protein